MSLIDGICLLSLMRLLFMVMNNAFENSDTFDGWFCDFLF